ncbi:hypothetical protein QYM36_004813, partial [Artemia franciscana]
MTSLEESTSFWVPLSNVLMDEDYYVDQLPKYLSPNRHFRPPSREEDPWYRQGNAAFKNSIPQIYLRPHSRLVEELESEDDLIAQLAAPFEKQLLRNVVKVQDLENSKHRIMDPNHGYTQNYISKKNSIPQIYLRPHSRLVEELESKDDLIAQLAAPFEKQLLRNVVKVQDLDTSRHIIMDPNHDRRRVENMPPRIHLPSDDDQIVPGPKVNNQGKFGYLPSDPQFSEPDRDTSKEGVDDMKKLVN